MPTVSPSVDPVDIHVGARIREERVAAGLTQSQLGASIGVTFQQVQKYERGANRVSASMVVRIADTLGLSVAALFPPQGDRPETLDDALEIRGGRALLGAFRDMPPARRDLLLALARDFASRDSQV